MDTALSEEKLKEVFDRITREVTQNSVGIQLVQGEDCVPEEDMCTVHISFQKGFRSSLSLRANTALLTHLSRSMLQEEDVTPQDLEDVTKEYFNVLCGHIARAMYQATRVASRLNVPSFYHGDFSPGGQKEQFSLSYSGAGDEAAQLIHLIPAGPPQTDGEASGDAGDKINIKE